MGAGDQGGFVLLTFDVSDDHDVIDGYRIYREIAVNWDVDGSGGLVEKDTTAFVPWGFVDAVPMDLMRVVVATLDTDAAAFEVAAERAATSNKQAFQPGTASGVDPYEAMARTMARSREAARAEGADGPLFAVLTPEALAFDAGGIVPALKSVEGLHHSERVRSNPIRAIDNIPPGAVPYLRALDTPGDAGGSITVLWGTSPDDRLLTSTVDRAVGGQVYTTPGVKGYNVYRKAGDAAFQVVGQAASRATSYEDELVFNGVRYTYQVRPYDEDNVGEPVAEKTALAIRNVVFDADGKAVRGLFGSDDEVGFDDFFILADQHGLTAADETFEPAFDLSGNDRIDLKDLFLFADFWAGRSPRPASRCRNRWPGRTPAPVSVSTPAPSCRGSGRSWRSPSAWRTSSS